MKAVIEELLHDAGITVNGSRPFDIAVHDDSFYERLMVQPELALAETYMEGLWDSPKPDEFMYKILMANLESNTLKSSKFWLPLLREKLFQLTHRLFNFQTRLHSKQVGSQHYDIGNDLYQAMLDKNMVYTCAYWQNATSLDEAQQAKLRLTCEKLKLEPGMTLLDIGCGFGSLAKFAAEQYGVHVLGITLSHNQYEYARKLCQHLPVEIRLQDYRDLLAQPQQFDRICSLGMFEHVGYKNYESYMKIAAACLKDQGLFLLHSIGGNITRFTCASQFINRYIFPGGSIPSIAQIGKAIEKIFVMEDWHNFGADYDITLLSWHDNVNRHWETIKSRYDEKFRRMWNYYLLTCAASFRARQNQLWQIVLSKGGVFKGYRYNR